MTAYTAHFDVPKPVSTGLTSWFEAGRQGSLMALINQPSGY
jgi:trehalose utilization protein